MDLNTTLTEVRKAIEATEKDILAKKAELKRLKDVEKSLVKATS